MWVLLKTFWPEILIAVVAIAFLSYIGTLKLEVSHYKSAAESYKTALDTTINTQNAEENRLKTAFAAQTDVFKNSLKQSFATIDSQQKVIGDKIRENKQLTNVIIPQFARELFNATTKSGPDKGDSSAEAKSGNVVQAGTSQTTLGDLLAVVNENDANHLKCIKQVEDWQAFWAGVEKQFGVQ